MCRFQCNQQCCPSKQPQQDVKEVLLLGAKQQQQQFARNNDVTFFSPDSSDESEDDEQLLATTPNHRNFNFWQSCHDNFFRSFHDTKFATAAIPCHDDNNNNSSSLSLPLSEDSEGTENNSSSQQNDSSEEDDKTTSSSIDGSFKLKSILAKRSPPVEKHAYERRVSFADRWGMQLASYRPIPGRHVDLIFDELELDFNEVNFPDDASDYWRYALQEERGKHHAWSFDELQEELAS